MTDITPDDLILLVVGALLGAIYTGLLVCAVLMAGRRPRPPALPERRGCGCTCAVDESDLPPILRKQAS